MNSDCCGMLGMNQWDWYGRFGQGHAHWASPTATPPCHATSSGRHANRYHVRNILWLNPVKSPQTLIITFIWLWSLVSAHNIQLSNSPFIWIGQSQGSKSYRLRVTSGGPSGVLVGDCTVEAAVNQPTKTPLHLQTHWVFAILQMKYWL